MTDDQLASTNPPSSSVEALTSPLSGGRLWSSGFLTLEERQALVNIMSPMQRVEPNTFLIPEGGAADELFIIVEGWACRYSTIGGGRQLSAVLLPGDVSNLDALMFQGLDYGVQTLTEATIVTLPREGVLALTQKHEGIAQTFIWLALIENAILTKWAQTLGRRSAKSGLAHLLCELSVRLGGAEEGVSRYRCHLTQEQMADALGLTPVHLNRVLQQLRAEQLISTRYRTIILNDVARLRRSCGFDPGYLHIETSRVSTNGMSEREMA